MDDPSHTTMLDLTGDVVRALTLYALAEFQGGHASALTVQARGHAFSVGDNGRGHGLDRMVNGVPYLQVIYQHFDAPFDDAQAADVQLQGIGLSLVNTLCAELTLTVRKPTEILRMTYRQGRLCAQERVSSASGHTGNLLEGELRRELQAQAVDEARLEQWLRRVLRSHPTLRLSFNGQPLDESGAART